MVRVQISLGTPQKVTLNHAERDKPLCGKVPVLSQSIGRNGGTPPHEPTYYILISQTKGTIWTKLLSEKTGGYDVHSTVKSWGALILTG